MMLYLSATPPEESDEWELTETIAFVDPRRLGKRL